MSLILWFICSLRTGARVQPKHTEQSPKVILVSIFRPHYDLIAGLLLYLGCTQTGTPGVLEARACFTGYQLPLFHYKGQGTRPNRPG